MPEEYHKPLHTNRYYAKVFKEMISAANRAAKKFGFNEFEDLTDLGELIKKAELSKKEIKQIGKLIKDIYDSIEVTSFLTLFNTDEKKEVIRNEIVDTLNGIKTRLLNGTYMLEISFLCSNILV